MRGTVDAERAEGVGVDEVVADVEAVTGAGNVVGADEEILVAGRAGGARDSEAACRVDDCGNEGVDDLQHDRIDALHGSFAEGKVGGLLGGGADEVVVGRVVCRLLEQADAG